MRNGIQVRAFSDVLRAYGLSKLASLDLERLKAHFPEAQLQRGSWGDRSLSVNTPGGNSATHGYDPHAALEHVEDMGPEAYHALVAHKLQRAIGNAEGADTETQNYLKNRTSPRLHDGAGGAVLGGLLGAGVGAFGGTGRSIGYGALGGAALGGTLGALNPRQARPEGQKAHFRLDGRVPELEHHHRLDNGYDSYDEE